MTTDLGELFHRHLTDKNVHGYHHLYTRLFPEPATVRNVLEVGIGTCDPEAVSTTVGWFPEGYRPGASLRAFADYFPHALIWGLDPAPDTMVTDHPRIITRICDSRDPHQICEALPPTGPPVNLKFDLAVDDGDHHPKSQLATLENLWPRVADGGWYVIEDVYSTDLYAIAAVVGHQWHQAILQPSQSFWFVAIAIPKGQP